MKLYQKILRKLGLWEEPPPPPIVSLETQVYNPLGCKVASTIKIDAIDLREHRFQLKEIREYTVSLGGNKHSMVDYCVTAKRVGQEPINGRLRIVPEPNSHTKTNYRSIFLTEYDSLAYNEGLHNVVKDNTKKFVVDDDKNDTDPTNDSHEEFWRVNDVGVAYPCRVKTLVDSNGDGIVDQFEVASSEIEFWDYSRMTDLDGVETEEFLFVEMNKNDGWFTIRRGTEINPERVEVF